VLYIPVFAELAAGLLGFYWQLSGISRAWCTETDSDLKNKNKLNTEYNV